METSDAASFTPFPAKTFYGIKTRPRKQRSYDAVEETRQVKEPQGKFPEEFSPRILGPTVCWKTFYRQADAFEFAQNMAEDVHVFAYESCPDPTKLGMGQRRYLAASLPVFWHYYSQLQICQRLHYEIIPEGASCKLYFDLEYMTAFNPGSHGNRMVDTLIKYVCAWLNQVYGLDCDRKNVLDLDASTPNKFSRHLIFQGPGLVFENNVSQGNFVKYIFGALKDRTETSTNDVNVDSSSYSHRFSIDESVTTCSPIIAKHKQTNPHCDENEKRQDLACPINISPDCSKPYEPQPQLFVVSSPDSKHPDVPTGSSVAMPSWKSFDNPSDDEWCLSSDTSMIDNNVSVESCWQQDEQVSPSDNSKSLTIPTISLPQDDCERLHEVGSSQRDIDVKYRNSDDAVNAVLSMFTLEELQCLIVKKKDGTDTFLCDLGVYTKNRNFRLHQSSKLNKNNHLQVAKENVFKPAGANKANTDCDIFYASLVTNVSLSPETQLLSFDGVKGSSKVSFTRNKQCVTQDKMSSGFICHEDMASLEGWSCTSPYPEIDQFITSLVSCHGRNGSVRHWVYWTHRQTLVYDIVGYRWCHNVQRQHKSNNIMYVVDIGVGVYYQKCHDPDCQAIKYRSSETQLPSHVLPDFFLASDDFPEFPYSKDTTCPTNKVEGDSEEEILLTAVEDFEMLQSLEDLES